MTEWLAVALGGAAGAVARFGVGRWLAPHAAGAFPWHTFAVNLLGCFALGVVLRWLPADAAEARALLAVGFCGGFTTFSTFGYETLLLVQGRTYGAAAGYVAGSVILGVLATAAGVWLGTRTA